MKQKNYKRSTNHYSPPGASYGAQASLRLLDVFTFNGPTSHRRVGREVKGGKGFMTRVGNMSSGTCMREGGANKVRGPKLNNQIVLKGRVGKLGRVPEILWFFVEFVKLSLIKLSL